jgi:DNA helicase II / ATP-dependent DNA helicase PcrA
MRDTSPRLFGFWWETAAPLLHAPSREAASAVITALAAGGGQEKVGVLAERLREAIAPLIRTHYPDGPVRLRDLDQLVSVATHATSVGSFLADLALDPPSSSADYAGPPQLDDDYMILSTVHSAKGLEWEVVHVIGASDGDFPSDMALTTPEGLEEERRLFYVALTRARHTLAIYVPLHYYHRPGARDDAHGYGKQSRFLTEQTEALCLRVDLVGDKQLGHAVAVAARDTVKVDIAGLWR